MLDFGLHLLARGILDVTFAEIMYPYAHAMAVVRVAQGAELTIKAAIAEEHPFLIFTKLPPTPKGGENAKLLSLDDLLSDPRARTLAWNELPDRLWAMRGYAFDKDERKLYDDFGRLRNNLVHMGHKQGDLIKQTFNFAYRVMTPMIRELWGSGFTEYFGAYDEEGAVYVQEQLDKYGL